MRRKQAPPYKPKGGDGLDGASMFKHQRVVPKLQHALMRALHTGNILHVAYLVALGANIDCVEASQGKSAAFIAWENGRADLAQWLESARWEAGRGGGVQGPADAQGASSGAGGSCGSTTAPCCRGSRARPPCFSNLPNRP